MRVAVLSSPDGWHYRDLLRAADQQHNVFSFGFDQVAAELGGDERPGFNLDADCVIVRTMPPGSLEQVVFRMDLLARLQDSGVAVFNPPKSIEAAVDKYLSLAMLSGAGIEVPETKVAQSVQQAVDHFEKLGCCCVVKPLFGSMGFGIKRLETLDQAKAHFTTAVESGSVIYQQRFIEHEGFDIRLLVIGDQVLGMKRSNDGHWITNISQGGVGTAHKPTELEHELALRSAGAVGAVFAGVDLVYEASTGQPLVVEVNAVPGWRATSKVVGIDVAAMMIEEIERRVIHG